MRTALARLAVVTTIATFGAAAQAQPPGFDPSTMADSIFQRSDKNGDGKITRDEAAGSRMATSFDEIDTNKDGNVTADEFKPYMTARMSGFRSRSSGSYTPPVPGAVPGVPAGETTTVVVSGSPSPVAYSGRTERGETKPAATTPKGKSDEEDKRPFVARYGNLPKEAPSWFNSLDSDQDGMIGLYEWRRDKRAITEFVEMDLNGDGYLTADEYVRNEKRKIDAMPDAKSTAVAGLRGESVERSSTPAEVKVEARVESASAGGERKRGQRREDGKKNPFDNR